MTAIRSLLFVPANSERKIEKGLTGEADALILDLEDSVATEDKARGRDILRSVALGGRRAFVRINPLGSDAVAEDLAAACGIGPYGIVLPKCGSGRDVVELAAMLDVAEAEAGLGAGSVRILPIATETAAAALRTETYGDTSDRLWGVTWGAEDLATDLGALVKRHSDGTYRDPFRFARMRCLFGAVAVGVAPVDTIYADFRDGAGLTRECEEAAQDGFVAKMAIHPAQVPIINTAFTPSAKAISNAHDVVDAFAAAGNLGVVALEGRMLDRPHLVQAQRLLARVGEG